MTTPSTSSTTIPQTTPTEQRALSLLRDRYHHAHDLFSPRELARLFFMRWLHDTDRLKS
jgi:hypothetical protein